MEQGARPPSGLHSVTPEPVETVEPTSPLFKGEPDDLEDVPQIAVGLEDGTP